MKKLRFVALVVGLFLILADGAFGDEWFVNKGNITSISDLVLPAIRERARDITKTQLTVTKDAENYHVFKSEVFFRSGEGIIVLERTANPKDYHVADKVAARLKLATLGTKSTLAQYTLDRIGSGGLMTETFVIRKNDGSEVTETREVTAQESIIPLPMKRNLLLVE